MSKTNKILLWVIILSIPFNGISGPDIFGELSLEASTPFILLFIMTNIKNIVAKSWKNKILYLLLFSITLNMFMNIDRISLNLLGDISGWDKYISSVLVLIFYIIFSLSICLVNYKNNVVETIETPVLIVAWILGGIFLLEFLSWQIDDLRQALRIFRSYVSINGWFEVGRIYGVSFEPSFNAAVLVGLWPLLGYYAARSQDTSYRARVTALLIIFVVTAFFSDSRTAILVVAMQVVLFLCLKYSTIAPRLLTSSWLPIGMSILLPVFFWYFLAHDVSNFSISDSRVSNLTRANAINALIRIWHENLIFGAGLGQFGFLYRSYSSSLSAASWEVISYFYGNRWNSISPSFSLHWRILAEGGVFGYLCFFVPFGMIFSRVSRGIRLVETEEQRNLLIALQVGLVGGLLFGISFDSFRNPLLWIYAGLGASSISWHERTVALAGPQCVSLAEPSVANRNT